MARTVLISQPNLYNYTLYMPYIYACLKTAVDQDETIRDEFEWLWPIYYNQTPEQMYEPYRGTTIDVLGLSCYTWNSKQNYELAALVRADNPNCLIVAGGPDPDFKDPRFFDKHPIDLIVRQDGETPFVQILHEVLKDQPSYDGITGVIGPGTDDPERINLSKPLDFSISPYVEQTEFFREVMARHDWDNREEFRVYWETDRGCPYKCNFCDWGSNTMSKVRRFPMERIKAEIAWMAENNIKFIHSTNANWGILPQDVEISRLLVENKAKNGYPRKMYYAAAKNNINRVVECAKILYDAGMVDHHTMGVQHTDPLVLKNMDRSNLPVEKQAAIAKQLQDHGLPVLVQMIFGSPGDTPEKWAKALTDVMELDIHEEYRCYAFNLLPNAPAADPAHMAKHQIRAAPRYTYTVRRKKGIAPEAWSKTPYIIGTSSYTPADWAEMYLFDSMISAFHNSGITQFLSRYLRDQEGLSYFDFYTKLFDQLRTHPVLADVMSTVLDHLLLFASDEGSESVEEMDIPHANAKHLYRPNEYILFYAMQRMAELTTMLDEWLPLIVGPSTLVSDLVKWSGNIMITPDYDPVQGRQFTSRTDWPKYFETGAIDRLNKSYGWTITQTHTGTHQDVPLTWDDNNAYIESVIGTDYTKARRAFFQDTKLTSTIQV